MSANSPHQASQSKDKDEMLDLIVIGGGPHALSLLCRLLEGSPFSTMTDQDHQRYHHIRASKSKSSAGTPLVRPCCPTLDLAAMKMRIKVIDANAAEGGWMCKWNKSFEALRISYLTISNVFPSRPVEFHPDALRTFAREESRECELQDITACFDVGCRTSPSSTDTIYMTSSIKEPVTSIIPRCDHVTGSKHFIIKSFNKETGATETFKAKRVVAALGNANHARIPPWVHMIDYILNAAVAIVGILLVETIIEMMEKPQDQSREVKLLVVGGGLTSAQLVTLAQKRGIKNVTLITRSKLKTSQFDLSLDWIGRNANLQFAKFWNEPLEARLAILRRAKNGGSITPEYMKLLKEYQSEKWLKVKENLQVRQVTWVQTSALNRPCWNVEFDDGDVDCFDLIWLGTGARMDAEKEPCLAPILEKAPIKVVGGLPALNEELKWGDLEFYMMSGYCALSLGPTAGNLIGGRIAADRIASSLWSKWVKENDELKGLSALKNAEKHKPDLSSLATMTGSFENFWSVLVETD
ncbi:hypothetical protein BDR26DRAFT_931989 [Obelidium mucronatum]|nr:hypothetical protein BDR26DRAFT_931989 [Obelidium mucronatum]